MSDRKNRQIILAERPDGRLEERHFRHTQTDIPEPGPGEVLCRTILVSIDPANRAWMRGRTYREQLGEGEVMAGFTLAQVVAENGAGIPAGTVVACESGWQDYAVHPRDRVRPLQVRGAMSHHMSVLGITGLTAYFGLLRIGEPETGQTIVISAAAGATGSVAGQIARILGCRAVGIAGSDDKGRVLVDRLGFAASVNYKSETFREDLIAACPSGIDIYFDNVGGPVLDTVLPRMNRHGRIVCCGTVSGYDDPERGRTGSRLVPGLLVVNSLRMEGFLVGDFASDWPAAEEQLAKWIASGGLVVLEDVVDGLESAPAALIGLLAGDNVGKRMVRVAPDPS